MKMNKQNECLPEKQNIEDLPYNMTMTSYHCCCA